MREACSWLPAPGNRFGLAKEQVSLGASVGKSCLRMQGSNLRWAQGAPLRELCPSAQCNRAIPGIEPGTSRTLSENHATRPSSHLMRRAKAVFQSEMHRPARRLRASRCPRASVSIFLPPPGFALTSSPRCARGLSDACVPPGQRVVELGSPPLRGKPHQGCSGN